MRLAPRLVEDGVHRRPLRLGHAEGAQDRVQQPAIAHTRPDVGAGQPELPHDIDRDREQFGVGDLARLADDVHVELEVLPEPPPLRPLVTEELGDREPPDGLPERIRPRPDHPGEGGCHLGAERDLPPPCP